MHCKILSNTFTIKSCKMKIALMGDIAAFGRYCLKNDNTLFDYFDSVKKHLANFDLVIGNLEAPFVVNESAIGGKSATISADPINIELLNYIGFTHLNLANNHIGDYGHHGYERTKTLIENNDIDWFGTEDKQVRLSFKGEKISMSGFCSFNTNPSPVKSNSKLGLNYLDVNKVIDIIKNNADMGYFNILSVHSGQEHIHMPSSDDVKFARYLANRFNYVYYGHHPHVIQGFETVNKSAVFYSLGNFIFDDVFTSKDKEKPLISLSESNKTGAIGEIEINNGVIKKSCITPIYLDKNRMLVGDEVQTVHQKKYDAYLKNFGSEEYSLDRSRAITSYISGRKKMRDFKWYLSRLNLNSLQIIYKSRLNSFLYNKHFSSKLKTLEID